MSEVYFVNHTHWDREWYFTTQDAQVLSEQVFTEVLTELEKHPEANFTLDGQTSIVDEYVALHPEAAARVRRLVHRGQLFVGPWYTQTDGLIPDVESFIRNLVIGINDARNTYGDAMMVGYLPDTFGFNANLPTILHQVGIDNFLFWRGINLERQAGKLYFRWHGLGSQSVAAASFPFGYFTGQIDLESKRKLDEFVQKRYDKAARFEDENTAGDALLMPSGIDQMNIIHNIKDTVQQLNDLSQYHAHIASYPAFVAALKSEDGLPDYRGELRYPTYARVHRTIGSVRHRIKLANFELEQKILRRIEPLTVIGRHVGVTIGNGLLLTFWKKLLECQPHDTLGGSISDNVAKDVLHRFKEANEIVDSIENMITRKIANGLHLTDHQILIFNTDAEEFVGRKTVQFMAPDKNVQFPAEMHAQLVASHYYPARKHVQKQTPRGFEFTDEPAYWQLTVSLAVTLDGLGYQVIDFQDAPQALPELVSSAATSIQNEQVTIRFENGQVNVQQGGATVYHDLLRLVDSGNDGDTYDYSPLPDDHEVTIPFVKGQAFQSDYMQQLVLTSNAELPVGLADRHHRSVKTTKLPITTTLTLYAGDPLIHCHIAVDNTILSHRLRLVVHTGIDTPTTHAMIQCGFVDTKNEPIPDDWQKQFVEKPVNIYDFNKVVGVHGSGQSVDIFNRGEVEYERQGQDLFITLLATTGQLGKPDLAWRPGRASGDTTNFAHVMMPTPLAEELGDNQFDLAIQLGDNSTSDLALTKAVYHWLAPSISYQRQDFNYFIKRLDNKIWASEYDPQDIPAKLSVLNLQTPLTITAIYPAYTVADTTVIRLQNASNKPVDISDLVQQHGFTIANALEEVVQDPEQVVPADDLVTLLYHN